MEGAGGDLDGVVDVVHHDGGEAARALRAVAELTLKAAAPAADCAVPHQCARMVAARGDRINPGVEARYLNGRRLVSGGAVAEMPIFVVTRALRSR